MTRNSHTKCAEEYVVKRGDSFYLIAHKLGVPLRDLLAANSDIHPARLMVGDVLCIPREEDDAPEKGGLTENTPAADTPAASAPEPDQARSEPTAQPDAIPVPDVQPAGDTYVVGAGQTVADVQLHSLLSRHTLESANPGVDLESLQSGQTLRVPKENVPCALPETYTLACGETLESVAMRFNLPVGSLLRVNPCLAPQDFEEGVTVVLPG